MTLVARILERVARHLPVRVIDGQDGTPLLSKYLLWQSSAGRGSYRLDLHRFHRGDQDRDLHNHPWAWGVSLILAGGYVEQYLRAGRIMRRVFTPGMVNVLGLATFHRVTLRAPGREAWTLFLSGPVVRTWGFRNEQTGEFLEWHEFYARKGLVVPTDEYWKPRRAP